MAEFCIELAQQLSICTDEQSLLSLSEKTNRKVQAVNNFNVSSHAHVVQKLARHLNSAATKLWNTCRQMRIRDKMDASDDLPRPRAVRSSLTLTARVYAVLVLSLGRTPRGDTGDANYARKALKVVPWLLRAARLCLGRYCVQPMWYATASKIL